ncbi:GGDEF domain-containing protein [Anaerostipes sp.]|uniref:GGDEF domain-containing protein n=1 Tax=Anaerostipes sp. TaxID=1872530 RepID=UPI0025C38301|nr:diguanylate cyclase [Anaerostipes sp.]MBS7009955.1 diguanylate cyclase [Anaerostipes sp.]
MTKSDRTEERYVKHIYKQIILLALLAHLSYVVIFAVTGIVELAVYNAASVCFYCVMGIITERGYYRAAVASIHLEVCLFVIVSTVAAGWEIGTPAYLMAMISLTYFCPFKHKQIPYLFAGLEIFVFLALKLYTSFVCPGLSAVDDSWTVWISVYSFCACFTIILYAAVSSKLSAAVSRQELQDENRSLTTIANYDQLTGLLSRYAFLERMKKNSKTSSILALSDIDDFKLVNDTWGHSCGDRILSEAAEFVRSFLGREAEVCRWGGEEFVYLFQDMSMEQVLEKLQQLCEAVAEHSFCHDENNLHITMTFGVSLVEEGVSPEEAIALADSQMYHGKACGKNCVVCGKP